MTNNHNASPNQSGNTEPEITEQMQAFYQRADAIIELANSQLSPQSHSGQVGASLLYAAARYSASVASIGFVKGDDLLKEKKTSLSFMPSNTDRCSMIIWKIMPIILMTMYN